MNMTYAAAAPDSHVTLAAITFAHPAMLAGLAGILVPIAIHLINRGRPRAVVFPTIRFLQAATASQSRMRRLRHLILMATRCAFIACLALAFARPLWFASADAAAGTDRDTVAIVLLDVSASMGYADSPASTMAQAATQTAAVIDSLDPHRGDRASVIFVGLSPRTMRAMPTSNLPAIRSALDDIHPTAERADPNAAIALAANQFAGFRPSRKELHIVSDLQQTNWTEADFAGLPDDARIILHRIGSDSPRPNTCIENVVVEPPQPVVGESFHVSVRLTNHGPAATVRDVRLRADTGGEWKRPGVALAPGLPTSVSFNLRHDEPGICELTAEIAPDALSIDDRRYAIVRVATKLPVVLCTNADLGEGATSGYLLARALTPFADDRERIDLRIVRAADLSDAALTGADILFLETAAPLSGDSARTVCEFLNRGGGVAAFLGFGAAADNLAAIDDAASGRKRLPVIVGAVVGRDGNRKPAHITETLGRRHRLLSPLGDPGIQSLQSVNVYRHFAARPEAGIGETIAMLDTGDAAIAAARVGAGMLLVCNLSPDPRWSDLAKHAVFPGLVHQFVSFLRPREWTEPAARVGMPTAAQWLVSAAVKDVTIRDPTGEMIRAPIRRDGPSAAVTLPPTGAPGFYRILVGGKPAQSIAVNVDPRESDLAAANTKALESRAGRATTSSTTRPVAGNVLRAERHGRPLWHWGLAAATIVLAVEMVCLWFWRR